VSGAPGPIHGVVGQFVVVEAFDSITKSKNARMQPEASVRSFRRRGQYLSYPCPQRCS